MKRLIFSVLLAMMAVIFASSLVFALTTRPTVSTTDLTTIAATEIQFKADIQDTGAYASTINPVLMQGQIQANTGNTSRGSLAIALSKQDKNIKQHTATANYMNKKIAPADAITYTELKNQGVLTGAYAKDLAAVQIANIDLNLTKLAGRTLALVDDVDFNLRI